MPATKYYATADASASVPSGGPSSLTSSPFPAASEDTGVPGNPYLQIGTTKHGFSASISDDGTTNATTSQQSNACGYLWMNVGAGTWGSGTWRMALYGGQSNGAVNGKFGLNIYIYRGGSKVATIYGALTELGVEYTGSSTTPETQTFSFTGSNVTSQNGDMLVVEIHRLHTQGMATSYFTACRFGHSSGSAPDATSLETSSVNCWIEAPDAVPTYSAGPVTSLAHPRRDLRIVPLI